MDNNEPVLEVEKLSKSFGDNQVLQSVSLSAYKGDVITILGNSGSGKSTLLRCINFLEIPDGGIVRVGGNEMTTKLNSRGNPIPKDIKKVQQMRTKLAMVFQQFNLWSHMTVLENLIKAPMHVLNIPKAEAIKNAKKYLGKVGMEDKTHAYPAHLSGGQQQRVAIARALAMEPEVLLFDEPTSALDPELVGEVLLVIRKLAEEGRTMLIVTHEMNFSYDVSSKVIFLDNGLIEESGVPEHVFKASKSERFRAFIQTTNM